MAPDQQTAHASALYEGYYLLGTSIARPLIAKHLVDIAFKENAEAISAANARGFELATTRKRT